MNNLNSLLNQHQNSSPQDIHNHDHFDPASSHDEFLEQMLSSADSFPWGADDNSSTLLSHVGEQSTSKMRQHHISSAAAKALMLQQQLLLSRSLSAADDLCSPSGADVGFLPMPQSGHNDVVHGCSIQENDASSKTLFNGFTGLLGQTPNQPQHFHYNQSENFGLAAAGAVPSVSQAAASGSGGGGVAGQPRQKVRARRGQATDPHSIAERLRRERIAERMKSLQEMVPNANKTDKASMLDEIIDYVKFLQLQVKVLSMSRLGGAAAVAPLLADTSSPENSRNGAETVSSSQNDDGMTVAEQRVAKLMSDDMGAAMQYLQGKGLCLMPISLATAISTTTGRTRNLASIPPPNKLLLNGEAGGPTSPIMSVLTVKSAAIGGGVGGGELATFVSKP